MRYYTAKGDRGTTRIFACPRGVRIAKEEAVFDALGALDELNSVVGLCRAAAAREFFRGADAGVVLSSALLSIQEDLFVIQAEIAGGSPRLVPEHLHALERRIEALAGAFPAVHSFVIPGATELGALLDVARAVARRAERSYLRHRSDRVSDAPAIAAYLNRLSSALYVFARFANRAQGESERVPRYDALARAEGVL